ncbi:family 1 glycosylhydrolase, partial [Enterococcus sp. S181_ASV_20]|nr:family 1 glycosylhydrolase [Enterococcus sp. S181_ASV_20]
SRGLGDVYKRQQLGLSIRDGVNLIGFCPWSFIDLLSVNDGMDKRYGLVYVDRDNFNERSMKRYKNCLLYTSDAADEVG